jgi:hypothetical protein
VSSETNYTTGGNQVSSSSSQEMFVLRETHKYIFFGPSRKDVKNTYFEAVYLYEKKLKIQAGQKVLLVNHGKEPYGVALVGKFNYLIEIKKCCVGIHIVYRNSGLRNVHFYTLMRAIVKFIF